MMNDSWLARKSRKQRCALVGLPRLGVMMSVNFSDSNLRKGGFLPKLKGKDE